MYVCMYGRSEIVLRLTRNGMMITMMGYIYIRITSINPLTLLVLPSHDGMVYTVQVIIATDAVEHWIN